ncbi:universal stress protein [Aeromicrobium terrae]|uniref:Universal stress protein n=1 Tax=Aeromicrobium terrae TaxID=2498846 RepID=A0A5C8ND01_9ACTN|nr:universal stress protein [Aeromicrobium terrae]TXL57497.1 universal stress protein [Aeromicrobium terrae]
MRDAAPVVAGIAHKDRAVLELALDEAERSHAPLHLVHTYVVAPTAFGSLYGLDIPAMFRESAEEVMSEAKALLDDRHPAVPVETSVVRGTAPDTLERLSRSARLIVIGPDLEKPWPLRLFEGRTARHLVRHAAGPVAIVPSTWSLHPDERPVVVLLDGISLPDGPLHNACETAKLHGRRVRLVQVDPPLASVAELEQHEERFADQLERWRIMHPDVRFEHRELTGDAANVAEVSELGASVLVVSRSLTRPHAWSTSSTARAIAQSATCPVVVVPPTYGTES